jgi:hypothetical protein
VTDKFGVLKDLGTASKDPLANSVANAVNMLLGSVLGAFRHIAACCGAEGGDSFIGMAPTNRWGVKVVRLRELQYAKRTFDSE